MYKPSNKVNNIVGGVLMDEYNNYKHNGNHKKKSGKNKVSFYISLAICVTAIGLAVWSTFTSYSDYKDKKVQVESETATQVNNAVTGVTVEETTTFTSTTFDTTTESTTQSTTSSTEPTETSSMSAVQTMLQIPGSLIYPVENANVSKEFSEDAVYNKTMGDYRSHLGLDFKCKKSDKVLAMSDGVVGDIYDDERMGQVIILDCGSFMIYYSGVDDVKVNVNDNIAKGDVLSNVGEIPCESKDGIHLHTAIRVNGSYIDPLSVISNNQ